MNIYFACSITGGREDEPIYQQIVAALQAEGHEVPTALLAGSDVFELEGNADPVTVYKRDTGWIEGCDLLVAEVTVPSLGVGYEIGRAIEMKKPVLCLFQEGSDYNISAMISGSEGVEMFYYRKLDDVKEAFDSFFRKHAPHRTS